MSRTHSYAVDVTWTGHTGNGYRDYDRSHEVGAAGKQAILGSADPAFRGVPERWNPEELLVASLSQCHMLWFLGLCSQQGLAVTEYTDHPVGTMVEDDDGGAGRFTDVVLRPRVRIADSGRREQALSLHDRAHHMCFVANSVNFTVRCEPDVVAAHGTADG